jgi:hypothetical protein
VTYGLDVSALDFKDLLLPDEVREALNRAAFARRLRLADLAEFPADEAHSEPDAEAPIASTGDGGGDPEGVEQILARLAFDRKPSPRPDGTASRPRGLDPRNGGPTAGGFDGLRRFRP